MNLFRVDSTRRYLLVFGLAVLLLQNARVLAGCLPVQHFAWAAKPNHTFRLKFNTHSDARFNITNGWIKSSYLGGLKKWDNIPGIGATFVEDTQAPNVFVSSAPTYSATITYNGQQITQNCSVAPADLGAFCPIFEPGGTLNVVCSSIPPNSGQPTWRLMRPRSICGYQSSRAALPEMPLSELPRT
jgi:hypothetical protein